MAGMQRVRPDLAGLADLVFPRACAGCGQPGVRLCPDCVAALAGLCLTPGPMPVLPEPAPGGLPPVWTTAVYGGVLSRCLRAYKDGDRRDLRAVLRIPLARALACALAEARSEHPGPLLAVPLPSSSAARRRRGDDPVADLVAAAAAANDIPTAAILRVRRVRDSVGLSAAQRRRNIAGAMRLTGRPRAGVILVDDVLTSGATMAEAVATVRAGGIRLAGCVTLAATPRLPPRG